MISLPESIPVKHREPLSRHTTMGVGGPARLWIDLPDVSSTQIILRSLHEAGVRWYPLGGGSDVIFTDEGFDGAILHPKGARDLEIRDGEVVAGAGWVLTRMLSRLAREGWGGLEGLYGIPGTVGGAVAKNAGAFGQEIAEAVRWVEVVTPEGTILRIPKEEAGFVYRDSQVRHMGIIWRVALKLVPGDPEVFLKRMQEIYHRRTQSQPYGIHSSGCIFRNPSGNTAGRLIDALGMKGFHIGGVEVSNIHANFLVHRGDARAQDVLELVRTVYHRVQETTGIRLLPEVVFVGPEGEIPYAEILKDR